MTSATGQRRRVARKVSQKDATARSSEQFDHVEYMSQHGHEEVATWLDRETGLRAIIAIHDTTLGPGLASGATTPARRRCWTSCASPRG
jgi:hypothetical protein